MSKLNSFNDESAASNRTMIQTSNCTFTLSELTLLLGSGALDSDMVSAMLIKEKRDFVLAHHHRSIFQMKDAKGYKKGKWKTYIYKDGKRKEMVANSEEKLYSMLYDFYNGNENSKISLESVFEKLCEYKKECLNRSSNTIVDDRKLFSNFSEEIKKSDINIIDDDDIRKWIVSDFLSIKPKISRFKKTLQLLDQIFNFGIRKKLCKDNPMIYISARDYYKHCDSRSKSDEEKAFSEKELKVLYEDCWKNKTNPRALIALLAMETGMRVGELTALHKEDITSDGFICVHRQQLRESDLNGKYRIYEVDYTKNERVRTSNQGRLIPITKEAEKVIEEAMNIPGESDYLFHDTNKMDMVTKDSYIHNLQKRCKRLGCIPTNNHAFRMAFNSRLIQLGIESQDRATILGHEVQTNESFYSLTDSRRSEHIKSLLRGNNSK